MLSRPASRLLAILLTVACSDSKPPTEPDPPVDQLRILAVPPDDTATAEPPQAVSVEVRDEHGNALPAAIVRFAVIHVDLESYNPPLLIKTDGFFADEAMATTDASGRVEARLKYGTIAGPASLVIAVPELGVADTTIVTILPGVFTQIVFQQDTSVTVGAAFRIRGGAADRHGNVRPDPVTYSAVATPAGAGTISTTGQVTPLAPGLIRVTTVVGPWTYTLDVGVFPEGEVGRFDQGNRFAVARLDGTGSRSIGQPIGYDADVEPSWSPDGSQVVFTGQGKLRILDAATGTVSDLPDAPAVGYLKPRSPVFSPDGSSIYFTVGDGTTRIARVDRDGTNFEFVTAGPADSRPSFAPDGESFVYQSGHPLPRITTHIIATGTTVPWGIFGEFPEWSPDGSQVAYYAVGGPLRIIAADGGNDRLAGGGFRFAGPIMWTPDNRWVLASRDGYPSLVGVAGDAEGVLIKALLPLFETPPIWRP